MTDKLTISSESSVFSNPKTRAIAALAIGVLTFALTPILVRLGENGISPTAVIFNRLWLTALASGLWSALLGIRKGFGLSVILSHPRTLILLLGSGICFAFTQQLWAFSLTQTSIANSALLHNFTPLFATLAGWLLFAQRFDLRFIIGAIITIMGSFILGFDDFIYASYKIQGDIIALGSALLFAVYFLLVEQIRNYFPVSTIVFYCCAIGTLTISPFLFISPEKVLPSSWEGWLIIFSLALTLLSFYGLTTYALKWLSSVLVTVIILLEPILTAILAWLIFEQALDFWNLLAFPIVLLGIYLATTSESTIKEEISIQ